MNYARLRRLLLDAQVVADPVGEEEVRAAEAVVGAFPDDYRQFLLEFGWAEVGGDEVFGLGSGVPHHLDVVRMTSDERTLPGRPLPATAVALMNNGGGDIFYFDSTEVRAGAGAPVYCWVHDDLESPREGASFSEWMVEIISDDR